MQITAESTPSMDRYSWEYSGGRASNFSCSPSGMVTFHLQDEVGAADAHLLPIHRAGDAMGHQIFHLGVTLLVMQAPTASLLYHGVGHGVGEVLLQAGGQAEHLRLLHAVEGNDPGTRGQAW